MSYLRNRTVRANLSGKNWQTDTSVSLPIVAVLGPTLVETFRHRDVKLESNGLAGPFWLAIASRRR
jgi:hypothetical protein